MIWGAIFLLCRPTDCLAVGSPVFPSKEACEYAVNAGGAMIVSQKYPGYQILDFRCVSFLDEQET